MRRKTNKDIRKGNLGIIILSAFFLLSGLSLPFLLVEYDQLQEKEIIIESLDLRHRYRGGSFYSITTDDGERYIISGDYKASELLDSLQSGTKARVKYHDNRLLFFKYAEEIVVNGKCIAQYNDDKVAPLIYLLGGLCVLCGVLGCLLARWQIKHERRLQQNRNQRIIKKYGSLKQ